MRRLPIGEFMVGVKQTALRPGELLAAVTVPLLDGWQGYAKVGVRNAMVIAISGACLAVDEPVTVGAHRPRFGRPDDRAGGRGGAFAAEAVDWEARSVAADAVAEFGRLAAAASSPIDDHRSTAAYRRHSIDVLARRLLRRAFTVNGSEVIPA